MGKPLNALASAIRERKGIAAGNVSSAPADQPRKIGRPGGGKRSNPDYRQVSAWVRRDTYDVVAVKLIEKENRKEFSELVQELLEAWLKK